MELTFEKLINLILVIIAVAIIFLLIYSFYNTYLAPETKIDFQSLPVTTKYSINSAVDNFISKLEECKLKQKNNCLCKDAFVNLPKEVSMQIINRGTLINRYANINFKYNDKTFRSYTMNNVSITGVLNKDENIIEIKEEIENLITFEKIAEFNGDEIISPNIYKNSSTLSFIVYKEKGFENLFIFGKSKEEQQAFFSKIEAC
ncbi:MAG: hypothetical protein QW041_01265 [Candidatus Pacearchaeota archaeon]